MTEPHKTEMTNCTQRGSYVTLVAIPVRVVAMRWNEGSPSSECAVVHTSSARVMALRDIRDLTDAQRAALQRISPAA